MKIIQWLTGTSISLIAGGLFMQMVPSAAAATHHTRQVPAYTAVMRSWDVTLRNESVTGAQFRVQQKEYRAYERKLAAEEAAQDRREARIAAARLARERARRAAAATPAPSPTASSAPVSTGGMSAFEACVIQHESGGNPTAVNPTSGAGGLFQFLPSTWANLGFAAQYPGGAQTAPVSVQDAAFNKLYAEAGTAPWAPYDGC